MTLLPASAPRVATVPFASDLRRFGDRVALVTDSANLTYRELADLVDAAALALGEQRRLVLLEARNDVPSLVVYLAALAAGHPLALVRHGDDDAVSGLVDRYDVDVVARTDAAGWSLEERRAGTAHELHPDLALLLSTSGSTGSPKLVRLSHANLQANAEAIAEYLGIRGTDRAMTSLPVHYCYGLSVVNSHLLRGAGVVLTEHSVVDPCFWDLFRSAGATTFAGVPYTFELLDRAGFADMDLRRLRYVTQAGGRLDPEQVRRYATLGRRRGWDLVVMYGQTEATARMAYLPPDLAQTHPSAIGVPIPGGGFTLEPAPGWDEPDTGELVYAGPNVMLGYAEDPADLALGRTVDVLRTGDIARRGPDGVYEVVGRRSRFLKIAGLRVDLQHVESVLRRHGFDACCAGEDGRLVVAVETGSPDAARDVLVRRLGLPARAVQAVGVAALPRLATGKPDYAAVLALAAPPDLPRQRTGPPGSGRDVDSLRALFAEVLEVPDVPADASFVTLGGDSLSYVEMSIRLEDALGELPQGWHTTPVRDLAAVRPGGRGDRRRPRTVLETSVALRAAAIFIVVGSHAWLFGVLGGAHLLLGIAGYNVARFQLTDADRPQRTRRLLAAVRRIVVPTVAWVGFAYLVTDKYALANVLLLNPVLGPDHWGSQWHFWFIEALVYILLALTALLGLPVVHRLERRYPFGLALAVVGVALLPRYGLVTIEDGPVTQTPSTVFWFFALGWAAARATSTGKRLVVSAILLASVPGFFDDPQRAGVVVAGFLVLLWLPTVPSTRLLNRVAGLVAGGSLYVYLTHWLVIPYLDHVSPPLAVLASFALGFAYWALVTRVGAVVTAVTRRRRVAPR